MAYDLVFTNDVRSFCRSLKQNTNYASLECHRMKSECFKSHKRLCTTNVELSYIVIVYYKYAMEWLCD